MQLTIKRFIFFIFLTFQALITHATGFIDLENEQPNSSISVPEETKASKTPENITPVCNVPSAHYRKKIAATFFPLTKPENSKINDFKGFEKGIGRDLLQRLYSTGNFLVKEAESINLYPDTEIAPYISEISTADGTSLLASIEKDLDVQYVISGVIRDLSYSDYSNKFNLPFRFVSPIDQPNKPKRRNIVIDIYLHDTLTEELIDKRHYSYTITNGMVKPDYDIAYGSDEFFATAYGQKFDDILIQQATAIINTLSCRPYTIRIIDKDKKDIYLNIGSQSRVKTGDILTMYHADKDGVSFNSNTSRKQFGWPKSKLRVTKVFPAYSIAVSDQEEVVHLEKNKEYILIW